MITRFVQIDPADDRLISDVHPVLVQLRPHLTTEALQQIYAEGHPQGLRFTAAHDASGTCVAVAGWRVHALPYSGRKLYIDDFVTSEHSRREGIGQALLRELISQARAPLWDGSEGSRPPGVRQSHVSDSGATVFPHPSHRSLHSLDVRV